MIIKRRSPVTGNIFEWDLPITQEQLDRWINGECIQDVMPKLTPEQREFLMTGCTPRDWDVIHHRG